MNFSLEIRNLTKRFGAQTVLRNVSVSLPQGKVLNLSGPSGSGKTTLLRCIAGLERFEEGEIRIGDILVQSKDHYLEPKKRNIGMVFQELLLWPHLTVYQNINFVSALHIRDSQLRKEHNHKLLQTFQIDHKQSEYPAELSGGEQQRVAIARALAGDPGTLLLDEPFNQMDATLQKSLLEQLESDVLDKQRSLVLVTHQPTSFAQIPVLSFVIQSH